MFCVSCCKSFPFLDILLFPCLSLFTPVTIGPFPVSFPFHFIPLCVLPLYPDFSFGCFSFSSDSELSISLPSFFPFNMRICFSSPYISLLAMIHLLIGFSLLLLEIHSRISLYCLTIDIIGCS